LSHAGPLRIAHVTATYPPYPGGAGNTAERLAIEQAARGHNVEVFTAPAPGDAPDPGGTTVHRIKPVLAIGNAPLIPSLGRMPAFDVVHLMYPFIFGAELVLAGRAMSRRRRSAALCVQYQNELVATDWRRPLFGAYEATVSRALMRAADRVMALSYEHSDSVGYLRRLRSREPERVAELPNGVEVDLFTPEGSDGRLRERLGIPGDAFAAAFVGTLDRAHHFKRVDVAIDAVAATDAGVHLVVAGGGELLDGFRERAAAAGVGDRVHFLGSVPHHELPDILRSCNAFVLTTEPPESFGVVVVEGMSCGLPVVATDYPGARAVVADGEDGLIVPTGDVRAVASALDRLAGLEADALSRMGERGRAKAVERYSWPRLADRCESIYAEAIDRRERKMGSVQ
jgi:glycosyltransferase involved in cell wall biosynthesis